eukprot:Rhum_TRINITY_DN13640_c0_g2::Rhum_TRINITY_DN13640_c0_g2_i1::g.62299::m.62299
MRAFGTATNCSATTLMAKGVLALCTRNHTWRTPPWRRTSATFPPSASTTSSGWKRIGSSTAKSGSARRAASGPPISAVAAAKESRGTATPNPRWLEMTRPAHFFAAVWAVWSAIAGASSLPSSGIHTGRIASRFPPATTTPPCPDLPASRPAVFSDTQMTAASTVSPDHSLRRSRKPPPSPPVASRIHSRIAPAVSTCQASAVFSGTYRGFARSVSSTSVGAAMDTTSMLGSTSTVLARTPCFAAALPAELLTLSPLGAGTAAAAAVSAAAAFAAFFARAAASSRSRFFACSAAATSAAAAAAAASTFAAASAAAAFAA